MKRLLGLTLLLAGCANQEITESNNTIVVVLSGQSNISGSWQENQGALPTDAVDESHRQPDWTFSPRSHYKHPNAGPATNIARELEKKYPGRKIKIVNAGAGGSVMWDWRQDSTGVLYPTMIQAVQEALLDGGKLAGFIWYQGESDAGTQEGYAHSKEWAELFNQLVKQMKQDLNKPDMQIVFAQIATTTNKTLSNWDVVQAQQEMAALVMNVPMIYTKDMVLCDDVHLDQSTFNTLAERFINQLN